MTTLKELIDSEPSNISKSDSEVLTWLTTPSVAVPIQYRDVRSYLHVVGKFPAILVSNESSAKAMVDVLNHFTDVDISTETGDPAVIIAINTQLDALVSVGLIDTDDKTAILALGDNKLTLLEASGLSVPTLHQIGVARNG
jgi:hypothetical protein